MALSSKQTSPFDEIPYLLHHLSFLLDRQLDDTLTEQLDIGLSQLKIFYVLEKWPYSQQRVIARILGQDESGISRQVQHLLDGGYIRRERNPNDQRQQLIVMTADGVALLNDAKRVSSLCSKQALTSLSSQQRQLLQDTLQQLHRRSCTPEAGCERYVR